MTAVVVPIDEYLPPFDPAADRIYDQPAKVIVLPVIRIERSPMGPFRKTAADDLGLPSDCEP